MRLAAPLLLLLAAVPAPALAGGASAEQAADPCLDAATEAALARCRLDAVAKQTAQIARLDAVLLKRAAGQPRLRTALRESSATWLRYRDAQCRVLTFESASGTAGGTHLVYCRQQLNAARIADLEERVSAP